PRATRANRGPRPAAHRATPGDPSARAEPGRKGRTAPRDRLRRGRSALALGLAEERARARGPRPFLAPLAKAGAPRAPGRAAGAPGAPPAPEGTTLRVAFVEPPELRQPARRSRAPASTARARRGEREPGR